MMGRVGGYNHLKQLGVGSTIAGQLLVGALGGAIFGFVMRHDLARRVHRLDDFDLRRLAHHRDRDRALASARDKLSRIAN